MFTVSEFVQKFEKYSEEELLDIHANIEGYSDEARMALDTVIENKGGLSILLKKLKEKEEIVREQKRIQKEVMELGSTGFDISFLKKSITSSVLSQQEVFTLIDDQYELLQSDIADKQVTSKTVSKSILGGLVASIIGGILWGLQMIFSNAIFFIFGIGLVLLCYGIVRMFTKQSKQNVAVFISTLVSVILALVIGQLLFEIVGYKG